MIQKEEIFKKAHLEESNDLAREYFYKNGLLIDAVNKEEFEKLIKLIDLEIYKLLADDSYSMVNDLKMIKKMRINKSGIYLYVKGSYFDKREAICFRANSEKPIYFCGWASGCNRIPFIKGFIEWCDWLKLSKNKDEM